MIAWGTLARETNGFNIAALAEWTWNGDGRDTREFAAAWAVREGMANPEAFADWAELMGPIEFDVFDSDFPICYSQDLALDMIRQRQRPYLGEGIFRYYPTPDAFAEKRALCRRALALAGDLPADCAHETTVVDSYIDLAHNIWQIAECMATRDLRDVQDQENLRGHLAALRLAGEANTQAIRT